MTYEEFITTLWEEVRLSPNEWRLGQKVFNTVEKLFGVARAVQFEDGIDCFYDDNMIDQFIEASWNRVNVNSDQI